MPPGYKQCLNCYFYLSGMMSKILRLDMIRWSLDPVMSDLKALVSLNCAMR